MDSLIFSNKTKDLTRVSYSFRGIYLIDFFDYFEKHLHIK